MNSLRFLSTEPPDMPQTAAWYLADLGEARGKQTLFTTQSPQRLKALREHALIESAVSSNRIEGVSIEPSRVGTVVLGRPLLRDRNEEEVHGYREALDFVHDAAQKASFDEDVVLRLHFLSRGGLGDAGVYKERDGDIIERYPDGRERIRFRPVSAAQTPEALRETVDLWHRGLRERWTHPLILLAAFNLDFLCVHPFRDGNGRVSRLLLLLQSCALGYEVGRYISLERLIEEHKERYYETLEQSSAQWHEGRHDPWPYIQYVLYILKLAYAEFEARFEAAAETPGSKAQIVRAAVRKQSAPFQFAEIQTLCPEISVDWIRKILNQMKKDGEIRVEGRGPAARWIVEDESSY